MRKRRFMPSSWASIFMAGYNGKKRRMQVANFDAAIPYILANEGGYSNNPNDPGGVTNHGISLRFLKTLGLMGDIDQDGDVDADDILALSPAIAKTFYRNSFWNPHKLDKLNSQGLATKILDMGVNLGSSKANKILQSSANFCLQGHALKVDGVIGPKTLASVNSIDEKLLIPLLISDLSNYYLRLCNINPALNVFLKGWLKRATKTYGEHDV